MRGKCPGRCLSDSQGPSLHPVLQSQYTMLVESPDFLSCPFPSGPRSLGPYNCSRHSPNMYYRDSGHFQGSVMGTRRFIIQK